jgi:2-(1,2-epoxy-1,2-dihydrophenyl)acetyl-CoA isomerase
VLTGHLREYFGIGRSWRNTVFNETLNADEALRLGLVNRVVPAADLIVETKTPARSLAAKSPMAVAHFKRLLRGSIARGLNEQLVAEQEAFKACALTTDFSEAISAFFENRPPT